MGEWVKFPTTYEKLQETFQRIGIGQEDDFGYVYEEWFITDYDCYVDGLYDKLGEYANLDELNYLASKLDEMDQSDYDRFVAAMGMGEYTGSIQDMINLCENLDCYEVYPDIHDDDDLGRLYIDEYGAMSVPEHQRNYIDYEAYGRDVRFEEGGEFTDSGYVFGTGSSFYAYYDGDRDSIPEEYRLLSSPDGDELEEPDEPGKTEEMCMGIAHDLDEYFRQHDPQYAADHPDAQLATSEIYGKLMDGRIAATEDMLHAMGKDAFDTFSARLEAFKKASGYEEWLDFDPAAIREALENPNQSHIDAMLDAAVRAEREYAHGEDAALLAAEIDRAFRDYLPEYSTYFPKEEVQRQVLADTLIEGGSPKIKTGLINAGRENGIQDELAPLIRKLEDFEKACSINTYLVYQVRSGEETRDFRYKSLDRLHELGHVVDPAHYELVYAAPLTPGENLKSIYHDLNMDRPSDYHARSMSMSDIVVMREYGKETAFFCDEFGFAEVPEFLNPALAPDTLLTGDTIQTPRGSFHVTGMSREQMEAAGYGVHHQSEDGKYLIMGNGTRAFAVFAEPAAEKENPLRTAEMTIEDDYGMIDGVINNGRRDEATAKPSIRGRLEDAKRECAERKPPEKKSPGRNTPEHDAL